MNNTDRFGSVASDRGNREEAASESLNLDGERGMHPLGEHQHGSIDKAENCPEALAKTEEMTGAINT